MEDLKITAFLILVTKILDKSAAAKYFSSYTLPQNCVGIQTNFENALSLFVPLEAPQKLVIHKLETLEVKGE